MSAPPRWRLVSFDLDGTLVDTAAEIAAAANHGLAAHGLPQRSLADITRLIGGGFGTLVRRLVDGSGADAGAHAEAVLASAEAHYTRIAGTTARPYPGCIRTLASLRAAGVLLACATNKELQHARRVLAAAGIGEAFALVVGGDTLAVKKPDGGVLRHVAATLGVEPRDCAHVGDSGVDIASARNAGFAAWAVPYGYDGGVPVAAAQPDRIFATLAEVAAHVLHG